MEKEAFLERLRARCVQHLLDLNAGELSDSFVALDLMRALISAYDGGIPGDEVLGSLPFAWRADTVQIPAAFMRILAVGWEEYLKEQDMPSGQNLGQSLGIEGRFQGNVGEAKKLKTRDFHRKLANRVAVLVITHEIQGESPKLAAIFSEVAHEFSVGETTVRNAYRLNARHRMDTYRMKVKQRGIGVKS